MSIIATAVKHLMAAGVEGDALVAAIADIEAAILDQAEPKGPSKAALRMRRYRANKASQSVTGDASEGEQDVTERHNASQSVTCYASGDDLDPSPLSPPSDKEKSPHTPLKEINSPLNPPTPKPGERDDAPAAQLDVDAADEDDREDGETKVARKLPRDWEPKPFGPKTEAGQIVAGWDDGRFRREVEKFTSHHRARGNTMKNWQRAWQTWVGNTVEYGRNGNGNGQQSANSGAGEFQELARLAAGSGRPRHDQDLLNYGLLGNAEGF